MSCLMSAAELWLSMALSAFLTALSILVSLVTPKLALAISASALTCALASSLNAFKILSFAVFTV